MALRARMCPLTGILGLSSSLPDCLAVLAAAGGNIPLIYQHKQQGNHLIFTLINAMMFLTHGFFEKTERKV